MQLIVLLLTGLSTACALLAASLALRAYRKRSIPPRRIEALEQAHADLEERHASLHDSFKRLNSRLAMREARAKRHAPEGVEQAEGETPEQWKARMRRQMALKKGK